MIQKLQSSILRFAILCDGSTLERWQIDSVRKILSVKLGTLVQIIRFDNSSKTGFEADHRSILFNTYSKIFVRTRQKQRVPVDSLYSIDSTSNSNNIIENLGTGHIEPSKVTKLKELNLDFALDF